MAKPELGTKRVDPETGKKFYDLNKEPIVSPFTGKTYPRSAFEIPERVKGGAPRAAAKPEADAEEAEDAAVVEGDAEVISLEEVEEDAETPGDPNVDEDEAVIADAEDLEIDDATIEGDDEAAEPFLEEEEEGDDVSGLLDVEDEDEDEV